MHYEFIYYDIETYDPSGLDETNPGPHFWYAVAHTSDGTSHRFTDAKTMWDWLVDRQSTDTVTFAVAHNGLGYDAPILAYEARKADDEWNTNAHKTYRGNKRIHRFGNTKREVYARDYTEDGTTALQPVVFYDSMRLMNGGLRGWAKSLGLEKGDTPIAHTWREITTEDWDYCERDVEVLRKAFQRRGGEELLPRGVMTTSADTRAGYRDLMGARKRSFTPQRRAKADISLPPRVEEQLQADHATYRVTWRGRKPHYTKHAYANRKALRVLRKAHKDALGVKAQRLMQRRANTPGIPFTDKQQAVWNSIQPIEGVAEEIIAAGVVPYSEEANGYNDPRKRARDVQKTIRPALRGGISRPFHHCGEIVHDVIVLDVNSLYPRIMRNHPVYATYLTYTKGEAPIYSDTAMWIAEVDLKATIKPGRHATIKRHSSIDKTYNNTLDWEKDWISQPDYDALKADYNIEHVAFHRVYYFTQDKELTEAIHTHLDNVQQEKDNAIRGTVEHTTAKLRYNSIWGRLAMIEKVVEQEGEKVDVGDKDTPFSAAVFITALARKYLADTLRPISDYAVYADTDSLHLTGISLERLRELIDIDDKRSGAWKIEAQPVRGRYLRPKTYIHEYEDGHTELTTAGARLTHKGYGADAVAVTDEQITVDEFVPGFIGTTLRDTKTEDGRVQIKPMPHELGPSTYPATSPQEQAGDCQEGQGA